MTATQFDPRGTSLRELLPDAEFLGLDDLRIVACCGDSRACSPGDLFVAMVGPRHDGHEFIPHAIANGAVAVLAERPLPAVGVPVVVVPDTRIAYGQVCQALAGRPSRDIKVIGVSGTNGKTSVSCLIAAMLEQAGCAVGLLNSLGYCDGQEFESPLWPTPPAPVLAHWLARMRDNDCTHAVVEASSTALSQSYLSGVELDAACLTNIRSDHLRHHGSLTNYRAAKARLFDHLSPHGFAVINADDPVSEGLLPKLNGPALTVSLREDAEITATLLERCRSEQTFLISAGTDTIPVRTPIIGDAHITNCLLAAAIGLTYGLDLPTIARGLESVKKIPGRLERIECGQPFGVFVDESATADRLANALLTLREVTQGRLICVASIGEGTAAKRHDFSKAAEGIADVVVATGESSRDMESGNAASRAIHGISSSENFHVVRDRELAIRWALNDARPGDCVLITGDRRGVGRLLSAAEHETGDRALAKEWLYDQGAFLAPTSYR